MDRPRRSVRATVGPSSTPSAYTPSAASVAVDNMTQSPSGMMAPPSSTPLANQPQGYASRPNPYIPSASASNYNRSAYNTSYAIPGQSYAQGSAYPAHQQESNIVIPPSSSEPMKIFEPIGRGQARYTTFASRMRNGTTSLMQPLNFSDTHAGADPVNPRAQRDRDRLRFDRDSGTPDRSRRAVRKYYGEELDEADLEESDDDDKRKTNASGLATPADDDEPEPKQYNQGVNLPMSKIQFRHAMTTGHRYFTDAEMARAASIREVLVPIRIDIDTDQHRIKDVFTWNITDPLVKPADFARILAQDLELPVEYAEQIEAAIIQQLEELGPFIDTEMMIGPARGGLWKARDASSPTEAGKESRQWDYGIREEFERSVKRALQGDYGDAPSEDDQPRKRLRTEAPSNVAERVAKGAVDDGGDIEDDIRVITDYEVQILRHNLRDRLEWDLCSPLTPEAFATRICMDLGLSSEARNIISHALREQIINHKRAAVDCDLVGAGDVYAKALRTLEGGDEKEKDEAVSDAVEGVGAGASQQASAPLLSELNADAPGTALPSGVSTPAVGSGVVPTVTTSIVPTPSLTRATSFVDTAANSGAATPSAPLEVEEEPASLVEPEEDEYVRREIALNTLKDLQARGPRPLEGAWRDWFESLEFGPLLERLSEEDIDRLEEASNRASRRNRRDQQRAGGTSTAQRFRRR